MIKPLRTLPIMGRAHRLGHDSTLIRRISIASPFERWLMLYTVRPAELRSERVLHSAQDLTRLLP